jgi:acetoin utilization protein AcuB
MKIGDWMTRDPVVVAPDTLLMEARKKMNEYKVHHLPVIKKGKLVGILTRHNLLEASPSSATTLSIHELSYLLANMKVGEIMEKDVVWVSPDTPVEDVLLLAHKREIGSFPVVENGKLVGIATTSDVTRALIEIFAAKEENVLRLTLLAVDVDEETLPKVADILKDNHATPLSIFSIPRRGAADRLVIIRCKTKRRKVVIDALKQAGFVIERVSPRRLSG